MPINTRVSRGEGWNVPLTRVNGYYTEVYGVLVKGEGEKTFCLSKISSLIKIMSEFASRYFFGIFLCSYHYFLYLCPQKKVFLNNSVMEQNQLKEVPYGVSDFDVVRRDNLYYVDKTMYLPK